MIGKTSANSKPVTLAEVESILEKRKNEGEMGYEQQACLDYVKKFNKLTKEQADDMLGELMKNESVKEAAAIKIVDILPAYKSQLKMLLAKERIELSEDELAKLMATVQKYRAVMRAPPQKAEEAKEGEKPAEEEVKKEEKKEEVGEGAEKKEEKEAAGEKEAKKEKKKKK